MTARPPIVEVFEDKAGEWRFRLKFANGEIGDQSEGYASKSNAVRGAERVHPDIVLEVVN